MTASRGRTLIVATAMLLAGCASGVASDRPSDPGTTGPGTAQPSHRESPSDAAQKLLDEARVPSGAVQTATPPTETLRHPPEAPGGAELIVKYRWWRIDKPLASTYAWVSHHQSAEVSSMGSSSSSGPTRHDQEYDADFAPAHLPGTVNSAELSIAVAPLTAQISAIGAFAVIVRQPPRPQVEDVPSTVDTVTVITRRTNGEPDAIQLLSRTTVTGTAARQLVHDFDALTVQPPGERFSCPMTFVNQTAIFRSGAHIWSATTGGCPGMQVTLDGRRLPSLDTSDRFIRDMRAAYGHRFPALGVPQPMTHPGLATTPNHDR